MSYTYDIDQVPCPNCGHRQVLFDPVNAFSGQCVPCPSCKREFKLRDVSKRTVNGLLIIKVGVRL